MCKNIKNVIKAAGGVISVARKFGISRISIYEWIDRQCVPAGRVIPLAELTSWTHTPHMVDPILYPNLTDGLPPDVAIRQVEAALT